MPCGRGARDSGSRAPRRGKPAAPGPRRAGARTQLPPCGARPGPAADDDAPNARRAPASPSPTALSSSGRTGASQVREPTGTPAHGGGSRRTAGHRPPPRHRHPGGGGCRAAPEPHERRRQARGKDGERRPEQPGLGSAPASPPPRLPLSPRIPLPECRRCWWGPRCRRRGCRTRRDAGAGGGEGAGDTHTHARTATEAGTDRKSVV